MGVSDLREAFNGVSQPRFACAKATLHYLRANDSEWQVLTFYGIGADGTAFEITSDRLRPNGDVTGLARDTAQRLLDRPPPEPAPPPA